MNGRISYQANKPSFHTRAAKPQAFQDFRTFQISSPNSQDWHNSIESMFSCLKTDAGDTKAQGPHPPGPRVTRDGAQYEGQRERTLNHTKRHIPSRTVQLAWTRNGTPCGHIYRPTTVISLYVMAQSPYARSLEGLARVNYEMIYEHNL